MMMWVFAVLVVAVMGVIAMLAAGRGEPMTPAYDDRPDVLAPADRPIAADDLRRIRFPLALRGYRMTDVDALLSRLAAELEAAAQERDAAGTSATPGGTPTGQAPEDPPDPSSSAVPASSEDETDPGPSSDAEQ